jgi:hypothetical protein
MPRALALLLGLLVLAAPADAGAAEWLAGDLHVHSCASHDVWCGPDDEGEPWTLGLPVGARFAEAKARGLDYLAITDHNDTSSTRDAGFGTHGVIGVPGYENSVRGHAQVLGSDTVLDNGDESAGAINALGAELRARGGVLQANHPGDGQTEPYTCGAAAGLHWSYGTAVEVDSVEVLNPTSPVRTAEALLDCLLDAGQTPAVTGGSDSHWAAATPAQGVGNPTTWVLADERSPAGVLAAIRAGRTAVSRQAPLQGGAPLVIERDAGGTWELATGATVPAGTPLRVRSLSPAATGLVSVVGAGISGEPLAPGGAVEFTAPAGGGHVRATLRALDARTEGCETTGAPISTCPEDQALLALTSPVDVGS